MTEEQRRQTGAPAARTVRGGVETGGVERFSASRLLERQTAMKSASAGRMPSYFATRPLAQSRNAL